MRLSDAENKGAALTPSQPPPLAKADADLPATQVCYYDLRFRCVPIIANRIEGCSLLGRDGSGFVDPFFINDCVCVPHHTVSRPKKKNLYLRAHHSENSNIINTSIKVIAVTSGTVIFSDSENTEFETVVEVLTRFPWVSSVFAQFTLS